MRLNQAEAASVATELRRYGDYRESATWVDYDIDNAELTADLAGDPTYAAAPSETWQGRYDQTEQQTTQMQHNAVDAADIYREAADDVERTGELDLNTPGLLNDVIDNAGWSLDDPDSPPPEAWRRVMTELEEVRQQQQADRADAGTAMSAEADLRERLGALRANSPMPAVDQTSPNPDAVSHRQYSQQEAEQRQHQTLESGKGRSVDW